MQTIARARVSVRAAASTTAAAAPKKTLQPLNITKRTLIDSSGGRAVRNIDGEIYEVVYNAGSDSVKVGDAPTPCQHTALSLIHI